ncbi:MAG TPA: SDR family NAD(P)-dependent oxidoreductase [Gammaproteobacteria bacterium]|nr:SDR family NAD(P)-dependent oxidoreductase [Gammaproteobacteria bacterium]
MTDQRATARTILITGCSSGIGKYCALALRDRRWRVFATARREEDVRHLQDDGLEALRLDVTEPDSIRIAVAEVLTRTQGRLDALFNNAGYGQPGALEDLPSEALRAQLETNVVGTHAVTRAVLPTMRSQGHGRIVVHSSVLGFITLPYRGAYNASKFALEGMADTLRQELLDSGIEVSLIQTGPVRSRFRENAEAMFHRWIDVDASPHRQTYRAVERRLAGAGDTPLTLGPEAVLAKLVHAIEARSPKARYHVTLPSHLFKALKRMLPTRALDRILLGATASERRP